MKIKRKVEMNLPQLIEWLLKSGHRDYIASSDMGNTVTLSRYGAIQFSHGTFFPEETFTVEVEKVVTEDTKFKHLIEIEQDDTCYMWLNTSVSAEKQVNDCKNLSKEFHAYIDGEFKLIWTRENGLVE